MGQLPLPYIFVNKKLNLNNISRDIPLSFECHFFFYFFLSTYQKQCLVKSLSHFSREFSIKE